MESPVDGHRACEYHRPYNERQQDGPSAQLGIDIDNAVSKRERMIATAVARRTRKTMTFLRSLEFVA